MDQKVISALRELTNTFKNARSLEEYTTAIKTLHIALDSDWESYQHLKKEEIVKLWKNLGQK